MALWFLTYLAGIVTKEKTTNHNFKAEPQLFWQTFEVRHPDIIAPVLYSQ